MKFPAALRFLLATVWFAAAVAHGQANHAQPNELVAPRPIDPAQGASNLAAFRTLRLAGDFALKFQLTHRPPKGAETFYDGFAWGTWNDAGPLTRFQLRPVAGRNAPFPDPAKRDAQTYEWLVQNGAAPHIWALAPGAAPRELPAAEWHTPLFPGLVYTPYDLLMPFTFWPKDEYSGAERKMGREADAYTMQPPDSAAGARPVRLWLDREMHALLAAEELDAQQQAVKVFEIQSFSQWQKQWIPHTIDLREPLNQDVRDRFSVAAAALDQHWPPAVFEPGNLTTPGPVPPAADWADK